MTVAQRSNRTLHLRSRDMLANATTASNIATVAFRSSSRLSAGATTRPESTAPAGSNATVVVRHFDRPVCRDNGPLTSEQLLRGEKVVQIQHHGETYQLRATRHGKLILTK